MDHYIVQFKVRVKADNCEEAMEKALGCVLSNNVVLVYNDDTDEVEYEYEEKGTTNYTVKLEVSVKADDCDEAMEKALRCEPSDMDVLLVYNANTGEVEYEGE